jgi:hypothetical protein
LFLSSLSFAAGIPSLEAIPSSVFTFLFPLPLFSTLDLQMCKQSSPSNNHSKVKDDDMWGWAKQYHNKGIKGHQTGNVVHNIESKQQVDNNIRRCTRPI